MIFVHEVRRNLVNLKNALIKLEAERQNFEPI